jgi:hypothetical protein
MKVKALIERLEEFDPDQEIIFFELSDFYDTIYLGMCEKNDKVEITIKNVQREEGDLLQ